MGNDPQPRSAAEPLTLDPLAQAVSSARHYVRDALPALGGEGLRDNAQLAVSELVTNATLHARTPMTIGIERTPAGRIRINVRDHCRSVPQPRAYALTATTGRGLRLVDAVCTAWGIDAAPDGDGKIVWCEPALDASVVPGNGDWSDVLSDLA